MRAFSWLTYLYARWPYFSRFMIAGAIHTVAFFIAYYLLTARGTDYVLAVAMSITLQFAISFVLQKTYVFRCREAHPHVVTKQFLMTLGVWTLTALANMGLLWLEVAYVGLAHELAEPIAYLITSPPGFLFLKKIFYSHPDT